MAETSRRHRCGESLVRWEDSDVRPDFSDARLTLGYCLGDELSTDAEDCDRRLVSADLDRRTTEAEDCDRRLVSADLDRRTTEAEDCDRRLVSADLHRRTTEAEDCDRRLVSADLDRRTTDAEDCDRRLVSADLDRRTTEAEDCDRRLVSADLDRRTTDAEDCDRRLVSADLDRRTTDAEDCDRRVLSADLDRRTTESGGCDSGTKSEVCVEEDTSAVSDSATLNTMDDGVCCVIREPCDVGHTVLDSCDAHKTGLDPYDTVRDTCDALPTVPDSCDGHLAVLDQRDALPTVLDLCDGHLAVLDQRDALPTVPDSCGGHLAVLDQRDALPTVPDSCDGHLAVLDQRDALPTVSDSCDGHLAVLDQRDALPTVPDSCDGHLAVLDQLDAPPTVPDSCDGHLAVLDRFDVIAGIADECDVTATTTASSEARPDIMEDCHLRLDIRPDIADICDIVLELDAAQLRPDVVDINDINLYQLENDANTLESIRETRPDLVEHSDVPVAGSIAPDISAHYSDIASSNAPDISEHYSDVANAPDISEHYSEVASSNAPDISVHYSDVASSNAPEISARPDSQSKVSQDDDDDGSRPGSVGHLLKLVRALANNLGAEVTGTPGGNTNLGFEDSEGLATTTQPGERVSQTSSNEDIDWSWLADETQLCATNTSRPSSWLRASMRRVRRFALSEPQVRATTAVRCSAPPALVCDEGPHPRPDILPSAPPPDSPRAPRDPEDFPRRYSNLGRLEGRRPPELTPEQPSEPTTEDESNSDYDEPEETKDWWPHSLSSLLASLGCTLGLFNVSRFAILSVHFGANFVIQFLFLSLVVGWPLYTLHASLGQHLKAGVVDMWRISPLFQGIGIALLMAQAMLGLYSVVGVAWMFTYFRDSFINKYDAYRWAENGTRVEDSVPEYLNTVVLQRQGSSTVGHLKFQVTFNLAVVWMIVFVCLSKGVKSYGKSVYLFATVPILGISILAIKVLTLTDIWFDHTAWNELFMNSNCWTAAAIECMMTWGLLGAATMQMRSHSACCRLSRECLAVGAITVATLVSAALLANGFAQILWSGNLRYVPSSYEHSAVFLSPAGAPRLSSTPVRWMPHAHHVVGLQVSLPGAPVDTISGYQAAQFATELAPAVFAKLGPQAVSPFWTVLFYFTLILLGISQQLCIWHCVITGIMAINITRLRSWETTITFLSCSCGFVLGLPMTTELGIAVVYFMDYCVGGAWWLILLQAAQIIAALMAQGGEQVAHTLLGSRRSCLQAFVVFTWNVVLPLALTVVSVTWFRTNHYRDLYSSRHHGYWPAWARRLGCLLQLVPLIIVPLVAAVQTWRYLTKGPSDLFDRLRLLCRPGPSDSLANQTTTPTVSSPSQPLPEMTSVDDPPPKYTPPPSYSTATGARIAKMLRRSFRRLVGPSVPSPPDYSAVLVEMGGAEIVGRTSTLSAVEVAHILRSSMRRTLRREQVRSAPSQVHDSSKTEPVIL